MNSFDRKELFYLNKDIPIFHQFYYQDLAAFKIFFWMKSIMQYPSLLKSRFSIEDFSPSLQAVSNKIIEEYNKIPSVEVWNEESIHSTLRQIEYYEQTKAFWSSEDIINLYTSLDKTIDHIEKQAELGLKFSLRGEDLNLKTPYKIFVNEFILGDHTLCALLNDSKVVFNTMHAKIEKRKTAVEDYSPK